jgi:hypothetical protein
MDSDQGVSSDHPDADLEDSGLGTLFRHLAHDFVPEDVHLFEGQDEAVVEVEVGSAEGGGRYLDKNVLWIGNSWAGRVLDADIS